jgi:hypothetical protein
MHRAGAPPLGDGRGAKGLDARRLGFRSFCGRRRLEVGEGGAPQTLLAVLQTLGGGQELDITMGHFVLR